MIIDGPILRAEDIAAGIHNSLEQVVGRKAARNTGQIRPEGEALAWQAWQPRCTNRFAAKGIAFVPRDTAQDSIPICCVIAFSGLEFFSEGRMLLPKPIENRLVGFLHVDDLRSKFLGRNRAGFVIEQRNQHAAQGLFFGFGQQTPQGFHDRQDRFGIRRQLEQCAGGGDYDIRARRKETDDELVTVEDFRFSGELDENLLA